MNSSPNKETKYRVYKSDISYFSGKLEAYLRYKEIDHQLVDVDRSSMDHIAGATGIKKMPAVELNEGSWLFDTTPMIQWFESQHPEPATFPSDPALRFLALLIEDYADEWLWRPAMWWRWIPRASRWALGWRIAKEFMPSLIARPFGWYFGRRQRKEWLWDDGMTKENSQQIADIYLQELRFLEAVFETQNYILGSHPSIVDFAYFASMFRHFGNDVESAEVMRRQAPNTYEWLARLWNAKPHKLPEKIAWSWPQGDQWQALWLRIVEDYLPYLQQNAQAFESGGQRFDFASKNFSFMNSKTTSYRVWCLERLQVEFSNLAREDQQRLEQLFATVGDLNILHAERRVQSDMDHLFDLPVKAKKSNQKLKVKLFGQPRN